MTKTVCAMACCATLVSAGAEIIGPYNVTPPVSAVQVAGRGVGWNWINVANSPLTINAAFSGPGIINGGYANGPVGTSVQMNFASPVVNRPGDELVMFDSRFSLNDYAISVDYDAFTFQLPLPNTAFSLVAIRSYYFGGGGPFGASVMAAPIDLSSLGVPLGGSVTGVRFTAVSNEIDPLGIGALVPSPAMLVASGVVAARRRR